MIKNKMEDTKKEILLYLGRYREGYYYGICKYSAASRKKKRVYQGHVWQSHVWRALQELKSEHLIESYKHKKQIEKGQKKRPYYRLTIIGLLKIFTYDDLPEYLGSIVENNANKALILSEWDYFEKQGAKEKIIDAIKDFYNSYVSKDLHRLEGSLEPDRQRPSVKRELDRYILFYHLPLVRLAPFFKMERTPRLMLFEQFRLNSFSWIRIWWGRPKLRRYMIKEITQEEIMARDTLLFISEAKVLFKSLAQPVGATEKKISDSVSYVNNSCD
jgi:hypothetical protein